MIITTVKDCSRYENVHPKFKELFDYIKSHNMLDAPLGRIELSNDNLFINNVELNGVSVSDQPLEVHRKYIDVHMLLDGQEQIGWLPTEFIQSYIQDYDTDKECALSSDLPSIYLSMNPGDIVIVYPEDAHAPAIGNDIIRKIIAKVKL